MKTNPLITVPLWALVILGFVGAASVSIANFNGAACPSLFSIPVCYVVLVAYGLMFSSLVINHNGCKHHFFCVGWGLAFVIAFFASLAEFFAGSGICPSSEGGLRGAGGTPLCYVSLAMLIVILVLFIQGPYKRACKLQN
jgi:hypothetical protein